LACRMKKIVINFAWLFVGLAAALYAGHPMPINNQETPRWEETHFFGLGLTHALAYSPDGRKLVVATIAGAQVWDVTTWQMDNQLIGHQDWVRSVSWSPDQTQIVTASDDRTLRIWDAGTGQLLATWMAHKEAIYAVAWSPDGTKLASGSG